MALSRNTYRRLTDLYVEGQELVLKDGTVIWCQALNPYEMDEARHDAQAARSRLILALKEHGSEELDKVEGRFAEDGREKAIDTLVDAAVGMSFVKIVDEMRADPEWAEKLDMVERDELLSSSLSPAEQELVDQINVDYLAEVNRRLDEEREYERLRLKDATDDELRAKYVENYIDRRGTDVAMGEFRLTEVWYGARMCDGHQNDDGTWSHRSCEGHRSRVFESKNEVRELPATLQDLIFGAFSDLTVSVREAKTSGSPASSSDSSPLPSEEEASTPSTPGETPATAPGTSPSPSPTP